MSRIEWNKAGERRFEAGTDHCVLYPRVGPGVPWNGLVGITESTDGGEVESLYFDGVKYLDLRGAEDFSASLEAYSAPLEFAPSDGQKYISPGLSVTQQPRRPFGLCYRTLVGNDLVGEELGYKLHLVYNCTASPADRANKTLTASIEATTRTWKIDTVPPPASAYRPTAHLVVDSTLVDPYLMSNLETALYGRNATPGSVALQPYLPTVAEVVGILTNPISALIEAVI